jgi:hypothetical protein
MLKSAPPTFAFGPAVAHPAARQDRLPTITLDCSLTAGEPLAGSGADGSFRIARVELVRKFIEHIAAQSRSAVPGSAGALTRIDWDALEAAVGESSSLEQAVGRAIALADRICRGVSHEPELFVTVPPDDAVDQPFFAFSVADVVPDFGDGSRYRTRVARRVARIFANRRQSGDVTCVALSGSGDS